MKFNLVKLTVASLSSVAALLCAPLANATALPQGDLEVVGFTSTACKFGQLVNGGSVTVNGYLVNVSLRNNGPATIDGKAVLSGDFSYISTTDERPVEMKPGIIRKLRLVPKGGVYGLDGCGGTFDKTTKTGTVTLNTITSGTGSGADTNTSNNAKSITINYPGKEVKSTLSTAPTTSATPTSR